MNQNCVRVALFLLLFFGLVYIHQKKFNSPTPVSRLDLLHSLVLHRKFSIDAYHTNTPDKAVFLDSYYSDKAPGTVALALPPFLTAIWILDDCGIDRESREGWLLSSWIACAGSIGIVAAFGGVALFISLSKWVRPKWALLTTIALFLGAAPLPYSTMMFSHALVVGLLAVVLWAVSCQCGARDRLTSGSPQVVNAAVGGRCIKNPDIHAPSCVATAGRSKVTIHKRNGEAIKTLGRDSRYGLLAGFAGGLALASEYSCGLVVVALFGWMVFGVFYPDRTALSVRARLREGGTRLRALVVGALLPLLLIPVYSWACFRDPFVLPYSFQSSFPAMREGIYAIKAPDMKTGFNLLFSPARGFLFWTPFFLMAIFGYWELIRKAPGTFWITYLVPIVHIVVISGRVWDWPAGPAWGARLLSPIIPLLAIPCACGLQRLPYSGLMLALYSVAVTTLATITDACPGFNTHPNPLFDLHIPLISRGEISPNLGTLCGLGPCTSVALYYGVIVCGTVFLWRRLARC